MELNAVRSKANMKSPCISVVLNCYNEANYVGEALESILKQTAIDNISEIVVVDDGSEDDTPDIVSRYAESNDKIIIIRQNNYGLARARNTGVVHCTAPWLAFLDGDDIWMPEKIEWQLKRVEENDELDFIYGDCYRFTNKDSSLTRSYSFSELGKYQEHFYFMMGGPIFPSSVIMRRSSFWLSGGFDERFINCQDTEFWLRLMCSYKFEYVNYPVFYRREHDSSISANAIKKINYQILLCTVAVEKNRDLSYLKKSRESFFLMAKAIEYIKAGNRKRGLAFSCKAFLRSPTWCWIHIMPRGKALYRKILAHIKILGYVVVKRKLLG